ADVMVESETMKEKVNQLPLTEKDAWTFTGYFFSGAVEWEVDKQERINIPQPLRTYSKIEKECIVIGVSDRVEVSAKDTWDEYVSDSEESFEELAENLMDFDI